MCATCDRLRAENRELREELAEYERGANMSERGDVTLLASTLKTWPQPCKLIVALMDNANRTLTYGTLTECIEYGGIGGEISRNGKSETYEGNHLKVIVAKARRALSDGGIFDAIANVRGVGYIMPKSKAEEIRRVLEAA